MVTVSVTSLCCPTTPRQTKNFTGLKFNIVFARNDHFFTKAFLGYPWCIHDKFLQNGPLPVLNPQKKSKQNGYTGVISPYLRLIYHASFTPFLTGFSGATVSRVKLWNKGPPRWLRSASCTWQRAPSSKRSQASVPRARWSHEKQNGGPLLSYWNTGWLMGILII